MAKDKEKLIRLQAALRRARPENGSGFRRVLKFLIPVMALCLAAVCYHLLGPAPWKDGLSRETNRRLRASLEKKEDLRAAELFQKEGGGLYLLAVPPYCDASELPFPEVSILKSSDIEATFHDHISRLAVFDSSGLVAIATVNGREFFCDGPLPPSCHPLDQAVFQVDSTLAKPCFRLAEK